MRIIMSLISLMILTGCAVMDLNTMDTAVPIYPDKLAVSSYAGLGVDYSSPFFRDDYQSNSEEEPEGVGTDAVGAYKVGVALQEDLDIQGKVYVASSSWGAKAGVKKLLHQEGKTYYAIMPMLTHVSEIKESDDEYGNDDKFKSYGMEVTGLISRQISQYFTGTIAMRYNLSQYQEHSAEYDGESYLITHGGITANLRLKSRALFLGVEYGVEILPNPAIEIQLIPTIALGIGFQL
jgi:hypothetical protein